MITLASHSNDALSDGLFTLHTYTLKIFFPPQHLHYITDAHTYTDIHRQIDIDRYLFHFPKIHYKAICHMDIEIVNKYNKSYTGRYMYLKDIVTFIHAFKSGKEHYIK